MLVFVMNTSPPRTNKTNQIWNYDPVANGLIQEAVKRVKTLMVMSAVQNASGWYSVYGAPQPLPWNCSPTGNSNFLVASKTNLSHELVWRGPLPAATRSFVLASEYFTTKFRPALSRNWDSIARVRTPRTALRRLRPELQ